MRYTCSVTDPPDTVMSDEIIESNDFFIGNQAQVYLGPSSARLLLFVFYFTRLSYNHTEHSLTQWF